MTHSSGVDGGSSTLTGLPLTVNEIKDASLFRPDQNVKGFCVKTEHHILQKDFLTREKNASDWQKDYLSETNSLQPNVSKRKKQFQLARTAGN
jgi:hypothetical protein